MEGLERVRIKYAENVVNLAWNHEYNAEWDILYVEFDVIGVMDRVTVIENKILNNENPT